MTPAERDVLALLVQGLANKEIIAVFNKAEPTVKHQISPALEKQNVPSRARLFAF